MDSLVFHNQVVGGDNTDLQEYKDSLQPVFTRVALISHATFNNLKEVMPDNARVDRLFLGEVISHNFQKLKEREKRQPEFNLQLKLRSCFPKIGDDIWKMKLCLHPSDTSMREIDDGPLRIFNSVKGQRIALCPLHADNSDLILTPMPDDTGSLRLYLLGDDCNLHSPVIATLVLQVR
jgi:hypothetical protein